MTAERKSPATVTVHVPMKFSTRGGRKTIVCEVTAPRPQARTDNALLKAMARAHRWRKQIEVGDHASITELAKARRVNESYACRLLRLTGLAPAIVTDILNGRNSPDLTLSKLSKPFPPNWEDQILLFTGKMSIR